MATPRFWRAYYGSSGSEDFIACMDPREGWPAYAGLDVPLPGITLHFVDAHLDRVDASVELPLRWDALERLVDAAAAQGLDPAVVMLLLARLAQFRPDDAGALAMLRAAWRQVSGIGERDALRYASLSTAGTQLSVSGALPLRRAEHRWQTVQAGQRAFPAGASDYLRLALTAAGRSMSAYAPIGSTLSAPESGLGALGETRRSRVSPRGDPGARRRAAAKAAVSSERSERISRLAASGNDAVAEFPRTLLEVQTIEVMAHAPPQDVDRLLHEVLVGARVVERGSAPARFVGLAKMWSEARPRRRHGREIGGWSYQVASLGDRVREAVRARLDAAGARPLDANGDRVVRTDNRGEARFALGRDDVGMIGIEIARSSSQLAALIHDIARLAEMAILPWGLVPTEACLGWMQAPFPAARVADAAILAALLQGREPQ